MMLVPPCNIIRSLMNQVEGFDELPYLKNDMKYHLNKYRKHPLKMVMWMLFWHIYEERKKLMLYIS